MIISQIELIEKDGCAIVQSDVSYAGKTDKLWYSVPSQYGRYLTTEKYDGFIVGLLLLAMKLGEDMFIKGAMSEKLYYNLTRYYVKMVPQGMPYLKQINIAPDSLDDGSSYRNTGAVGTGFSGGVDSLCTVHDHLVADVPSRYKITHFTFHNVGAHNGRTAGERKTRFDKRYALIRGFSDSLGIDLIKIDSNLSDVLKMDFTQTHTPRNLSCPLLLQKLFSKFYYSSSYSYGGSTISGNVHDISSYDVASVHLLSTETLEFIVAGSQYSRIEKIKLISAVNGARQKLNICTMPDIEPGKNCSQCMKCCRNLFMLDMLGLTQEFSECFNLDVWNKKKNTYIIKRVLYDADHSPLTKEVQEYARSIKYPFTIRQKILAGLYRVYRSVRMPLKKVLGKNPVKAVRQGSKVT